MRVAIPVTKHYFTWLGGLNYIRTLVSAVVEHGTGAIEPVLVVPKRRPAGGLDAYPQGLETIETALFDAYRPAWTVRTAITRATGRDARLERLLRRHDIDLLSHHAPLGANAAIPSLSWVPDVQHRRLPELFDARELRARDRWLRLMDQHSAGIVISSDAGGRDLAGALADADARVHVLRFVTDPPAIPDPAGVRAVLDRLELDRYLYLPNQLWVHKNHRVVIEALGRLRERGRRLSVVATGDAVDPRNPALAEELTALAAKLGVDGDFRMLGRVSYSDVGALMAGAVAVVNPSLFEGWSTTVEEARALGKQTVLSDIDVHREQNPAGALFADPHDPSAFADALEKAWDQHDPALEARRRESAQDEHPHRRRAFAHRYEEICSKVTW